MIQETYDWITNCIYSCTNEFQLKCCYELVDLFRRRYKIDQLADDLLMDIRSQENSILITA